MKENYLQPKVIKLLSKIMRVKLKSKSKIETEIDDQHQDVL